MEYLDIVDENDNVVWINTRHNSYKNHTTNRVASIVILDRDWRIALQKRSKTCSYKPWYLCLSAGWHVSSWENYKNSAYRELKEELWIKCELKFKDKIYKDRLEIDKLYSEKIKHNRHYFHWVIYEGIYDWDFNFDDGEVEKVQFFSLDKIKEMIKNKEKITPWTIYILEKYYL